MLKTMRIVGKVAMAAVDPYRPLLAQIVITRRCNLACKYCFEYDHVSAPVPFAVLVERFEHFKRLRVVFVTLNGGEPLLHPEVVELVGEIVKRGITPMMNSNGFALTPKLIHALNDAGLYGIQISVDSLEPNQNTEKALSTLKPKLEMLAERAKFKVRINTVLGSSPPEEAIEVARYAMSQGFDTQCSLIRDASGAALPLDQATQDAYMKIRDLNGRLPAYLHDDYQLPLVRGESLEWKCRSGARYFHVDEFGLVHLCQPRAGTPGTPLSEYGRSDIEKYFHMYKSCSPRCPHAYAHIGSRLDGFRSQS